MLLDIQPSTILFTVLNLLVLYLLMKHFLFKPVGDLLDRRAQTVAETLAAADTKKADAEALRTTYEAQLSTAREEAANLLAMAKQRAQRDYQSVLAAAHIDAERLMEDTRTQLAAERAAMLAGARGQVAALALLAAAKAAGQALNENTDRVLIDAFVAEAGELQ